MQQNNLLGDIDCISTPHLSIRLVRNFIPAAEAHDLLEQLIKKTHWEQPRIRVYGKWHLTPRLVCFHADESVSYAYSQIHHAARKWTPLLLDLTVRVSKASDASYNAVLLNYYRDGQDSIGWHADDEKELGEQPTIASLSLGTARDIYFKPKTGKGELIKFNLPSGSLLIMSGNTQQYWLHHLPRRTGCTTPRINLTFRKILPV